MHTSGVRRLRGEDSSVATYLATIPHARLLEIEKQMRDPKSGIYVCDRRYLLRRYCNCFLATEAIDWMLANLAEITRREEAQGLCQIFFDGNIFKPYSTCNGFEDKALYYRFHEDEEDGVLNPRKMYVCDRPQQPCPLASLLLSALLDIVRKEGDKQGIEAEQCLPAIKSSEEYKSFISWASELQRVEIGDLKETEKKAFWINLYNTLALHGSIVKGPVYSRNPLQRASFFKTTCYNVGGSSYSLDDIEHGILRGNRSIPGTSEHFRQSDYRSIHTAERLDPRLHFLLNCCTVSSPPVAVLTQDNVENFLEYAVTRFIGERIILDSTKIMIVLPKTFDWYKRDFGASDFEVIRWVFDFLSVDQKRAVNSLSSLGYVSVKYVDYNWTFAFPKLLSTKEDETPAKPEESSPEEDKLQLESRQLSFVEDENDSAQEEEKTEVVAGAVHTSPDQNGDEEVTQEGDSSQAPERNLQQETRAKGDGEPIFSIFRKF